MPHKQPHIQSLLEQRYYLRDEEGKLLEEPRIRIVVTAVHEKKHLKRLVSLLKQTKRR